MVGCWTCRTRKKRCDQQVPSCDECDRLGLQCDGYGARPAWADGGRRENDYKMKLKEEIKHRTRSRRTKSLPESIDTPTPSCDPLVDNIEMIDDVGDYFSNPFGIRTDIVFPEVSPAFASLPFELLSTPGLSQYATAEGETLTHDVQSPFTFAQNDVYPHLPLTLSEDNFMVSSPTPPPPPAAEDFQHLLYYLDTVFWEQYPHFDRTTTSPDRSWVLTLFHSSPLFKEALLQVSRHLSTRGQREPLRKVGLDGRSAAQCLIHRLHGSAKDLSFEEPATVLASAITLLAATALTAFYGSLIRDRGYVRDSLIVSRNLLDHIRKSDKTLLTNPQSVIGISRSAQMLASTLRTSYAQLIWLDTLEAATTGSTCLLQLRSPIDNVDLDSEVENMFGCRVWILHAFRQVIELGEWKKTCLFNSRLSMLELGQRSKSLLDQIHQQQILTAPRRNSLARAVTGDDRWLTSHRFLSPQSRRREAATSTPHREDDVDLITRIYAQAVTVYLHVVVLGANSGLLEIQSAITTALDLLAQFDDNATDNTLGCVLWPLMIFSFLSTQSQREQYRLILAKGIQQPRLQRACTEILGMTQKVWQLTSEHPTVVWDWESIIERVMLA